MKTIKAEFNFYPPDVEDIQAIVFMPGVTDPKSPVYAQFRVEFDFRIPDKASGDRGKKFVRGTSIVTVERPGIKKFSNIVKEIVAAISKETPTFPGS